MNWQRYLRELHLRYASWMAIPTGYRSGDGIQDATELMQDKYPGNYVVEQYWDTKKMVFDFRLKFDDPREETFWKIKNSS